MQYRHKILSGFGYHAGFKAFSAAITLLKISILARLLTPNDFGLFSLTMIALGLTEAFTETGINTTIIQSKQSVKYFINTAWVIAIGRGLLISVIMLFLGLTMGRYYQEQNLLFLVSLASLIPLVKGFINPAIISYYKKMAFFSDTAYRILLATVNTVFSIVLVFYFRSVFSLVLAILLTSIFEVVISFILFKNKPRFEFVKSRAESIFSNAKWLNVSAFLGYLNENLDNFLIGKISGTTNLGFYQNAYALTHKPYEVAQSVHHSTLPVYIRIEKDKKRLKKTSLRVIGLSMLGIIGISLPLLLFPNYFILLILGNQWLPVIPLVRVLLLAAILQSFSVLTYSIFIASKKYIYMNIHLFLTVLTLVASMLFLGNKFGLQGAVWAVLLSRLLTIPIISLGIFQVYKE
ncbi:MAG: oligosaccharide flippase family protein [Patescibacteria group bacterium]